MIEFFRNLLKKRKTIGRIQEITEVAAKHGLAHFLQRYGFERFTDQRAETDKLPPVEVLAKRLRRFLEDLGPTFVKVGQLLSVRPDLVPLEVSFELEKLQDTTVPLEFSTIKAQVEQELGCEISEVFSEFTEKPLASASIGQVHEAVLKEGGHRVAVKVQRPGIVSRINADLEIVHAVARLARDRVEFVDLVSVADEFAASIRRELDYHTEGQHADKFRNNFKDNPHIKVPLIFWRYSTKRVLVMEFIEGSKISDLATPQTLGIDTSELAEHGARAFLKQVLEDGFFHGDLHPANILVTPDGQIAYLDFGIVGSIPEGDKDIIINLLMAIIKQDIDTVIEEADRLGVEISRQQIESLRGDLKSVVDKYYGKKLGELKIDIIGREFLTIIFRHHIRMPRNYAILSKALITLEGTAKQLYPDINVLEVAKPYVINLIKRRRRVKLDPEELYEDIQAYAAQAVDFPRDVFDVVSQMKNGNLELKYRHVGLEPLLAKIDSVANRLALSLILASIIIGSAIVTLLSGAPGIVGGVVFLVAAVIAAWLVVSAWRAL